MATAMLSACAATPNPETPMTSGTHLMPGPKAGVMSNKSMTWRNPYCTPEALANMPPEHRLACEQAQGTGTSPQK